MAWLYKHGLYHERLMAQQRLDEQARRRAEEVRVVYKIQLNQNILDCAGFKDEKLQAAFLAFAQQNLRDAAVDLAAFLAWEGLGPDGLFAFLYGEDRTIYRERRAELDVILAGLLPAQHDPRQHGKVLAIQRAINELNTRSLLLILRIPSGDIDNDSPFKLAFRKDDGTASALVDARRRINQETGKSRFENDPGKQAQAEEMLRFIDRLEKAHQMEINEPVVESVSSEEQEQEQLEPNPNHMVLRLHGDNPQGQEQEIKPQDLAQENGLMSQRDAFMFQMLRLLPRQFYQESAGLEPDEDGPGLAPLRWVQLPLLQDFLIQHRDFIMRFIQQDFVAMAPTMNPMVLFVIQAVLEALRMLLERIHRPIAPGSVDSVESEDRVISVSSDDEEQPKMHEDLVPPPMEPQEALAHPAPKPEEGQTHRRSTSPRQSGGGGGSGSGRRRYSTTSLHPADPMPQAKSGSGAKPQGQAPGSPPPEQEKRTRRLAYWSMVAVVVLFSSIGFGMYQLAAFDPPPVL